MLHSLSGFFFSVVFLAAFLNVLFAVVRLVFFSIQQSMRTTTYLIWIGSQYVYAIAIMANRLHVHHSIYVLRITSVVDGFFCCFLRDRDRKKNRQYYFCAWIMRWMRQTHDTAQIMVVIAHKNRAQTKCIAKLKHDSEKSGRAKEDIEQHTFNVVQHSFFSCCFCYSLVYSLLRCCCCCCCRTIHLIASAAGVHCWYWCSTQIQYISKMYVIRRSIRNIAFLNNVKVPFFNYGLCAFFFCLLIICWVSNCEETPTAAESLPTRKRKNKKQHWWKFVWPR